MTPVRPEATRWTGEQNKRFEQALALFCGDANGDGDGQISGRWQKIAARVPGKSAAEVQRHYNLLLEDVAAIEAGKVAMPNYLQASCSSFPSSSLWQQQQQQQLLRPCSSIYKISSGGATGAAGLCCPAGPTAKSSEQERKKGIPWTEEEHRLFLLGLEKFGKGDWRSISRNFVVSRTPTQVASHAQKYFIRLNSIHKEKRRASIHDITNANANASPLSSLPPLPPPPP